MEKFQSLLLASLLTILVLNSLFFYKELTGEELEEILVERVIDGDTLLSSDGRDIRLANINTPEKNQVGYDEAKSFLSQFQNKTVKIDVLGKDMYGREIARIYAPEYLNLEIVSLGLGKKFLVEDGETKAFAEAEEDALKRGLGLWDKSDYFGCLEINVMEELEIVSIKNTCSVEMNLEGWKIADESRKEYNFQTLYLTGINLHTKEGTDNESDIYWNRKQNVWNNDRDTLYLFDKGGKIAGHESYGY